MLLRLATSWFRRFSRLHHLLYSVICTVWLKRATPQNIVISGAAGASMIGWAAVTGTVSLEGVILFLVIFLWTPPHFWALALYKQGDYGAAGIPMLPNVAGEQNTKVQILVYSVVLVASSFAWVGFGFAGLIYTSVAIITGLSFLWLAWKLFRTRTDVAMRRTARVLFTYSLSYLFVIFFALVVDHFGKLAGWA